MKQCLNLFLALLLTSMAFGQVTIVPQPVSLQLKTGTFQITKKTVFVVPDVEDRKAAAFFNDYLQQYYGMKLDIKEKVKDDAKANAILLSTRKFIKAPEKDAYVLQVSTKNISIEGDTYNGTFYGIQTLIQLLPVDAAAVKKAKTIQIPQLSVQDYPRFAYRGLHLDVGRHFMPVSFVKKYIDYIALHKMNYFHWHLTEDQGWRIQIKKYPRLTEIGAWRDGTVIGRYPGLANDNIRYGGFYTQDEIKDVVQYAADRHITIIPEIEMPGHGSAAIAAYPWLSCFPDEKTNEKGPLSTAATNATGKFVPETWGVFPDVFCAGKDSTFKFLEDVLDEVLTLFPSQYIHVGGDECPKENWKRCPNCQRRIKEEHLKDEHELQSYFIQRIEKYLNSKGRKLIGWDEILEGGLAPNAMVMSWRGEEGGIAAARQNHQVIMTPGSYVYFDHSQSEKEDSVTIGGYLPIEKVYAYEPIPKELNEDQAKYVIGAQANVWTEYMASPAKVDYMIFPRLSALSEVLWSPKEKRNWDNFEQEMPLLFKRYELWHSNYSRAYYKLKASIGAAPQNNGLLLTLETKDKEARLTYGIAAKHFQQNYTGPVTISGSDQVLAMSQDARHIIDTIAFDIHFNKATGKAITLATQPSRNYPGNGAFTLVDGIQNTKGLTAGREFLAWSGQPAEATIDLGSTQPLTNVIVHTLVQEGSWIYAPASIEVLTSSDGISFSTAGSTTTFQPGLKGNGTMKVDLPSINARYVKVIAKSLGIIPTGKPGAGSPAWLFLDEIEVN